MHLSPLLLSLWLATGAASPPGWWGLGGSALGPHATRMQGSASGSGVRATVGPWAPSPLLDGAGNPVVTWADSAGVHVARFQQGAWSELSFGASARWDASGFPLVSSSALALDAKGRLLVAWVEYPLRGRTRLRLLREKSGGWDDLTPTAQPSAPWCTLWDPEFGERPTQPTLSLDGAGRAATLCSTYRAAPSKPGELRMFPSPPPGPPALEVQRWDGKRWRKLPLVDVGGQEQVGPSVRAFDLDATGTPTLLMVDPRKEAGSPQRTYVLRGTQARWERFPGDNGEVGTGLASDATSSLWRVTASRDALGFRPLAPEGKTMEARSFPLTEPLASVVRAPSAVRFFLGQDGKVLATWLGGAASPRGPFVYVLLWTGTAWEDLGSTVKVHGGLSRTPGASDDAAVVLDSKGRPVVAWLDGSSSVQQVYLRRWNGEAWEELAGSAQGRGVSGEETGPGAVISGAFSVSLALTRDDRPVVAWFARRPHRAVAYVHEWDGKRWVELPSPNEDQPAPGPLNPHPAYSLQLTVDTQGGLLVAYAAGGLGMWVVYRWDGARWNMSRVEGAVSGWSLFATRTGEPGRWMQDERGQVHLARALPAETTVETLSAPGRRVHTMENLNGSALALDAEGRPVITWEDGASGEVLLLRWTGAAWEELSGSASGGGISHSAAPSSQPALAVGARTCVAWSEQDTLSTEVFLRCHGPYRALLGCSPRE